jgi:uncharacterized phage-associated protein
MIQDATTQRSITQQSPMIDVRIVANAVLERAEAEGRPITNLDLQKIVYFLHGHYLVRHHRPLVEGEFEAWPYGPVHRVLYDAFRSYNDTPIEGKAVAFDPIKRKPRELPTLDDSEALVLIDEVLDHYLDMPTFSLVELTHGPGTPWSRTVESAEKKVNVGMTISDAMIEKFFEGTADRPRRGKISQR